MLTGKCPVCQQGNMYENSNPYLLSKTIAVKENCSHCNFRFRLEPSFFFGAMYVSYALGVAVAIAAFIISYLIFGMHRLYIMLSISAVLLVLMPLIMRLSRNIWLGIFIGFDPKKAANTREQNFEQQ